MNQSIRSFLRTVLCLVGLGGFSVAAMASEAATPTQVRIGTYVQNIVDLNLRANNVSVDFYLWFRWKGNPDITPETSFELANGKITSRNVLERRDFGDEHFSQVRVNATLYVNWNLERFSLDRQIIPIIIEDSVLDTEGLVYVADAANISVRTSIEIPGYVIGEQQGVISDNTYTTNFGDPDLPQDARSVYSQYQHHIEVKRPDYGFFFKLFSSMFLAALIAPFGFAMKTENVDSRVGIGVGGIFGVLGSNYSIAGQLPPTSVITLGDQVYFLSMALVIFSLILAVINWRINTSRPGSPLVKNLDRLGLISPLLYVGLVVMLIC